VTTTYNPLQFEFGAHFRN